MADIDKIAGASSALSGGMQRFQVDPDKWLESFTRALGQYVKLNTSAVYDIRIGFPDAQEIADFPKIPQTIIHFEIEDVENPVFGFGDNFVDAIYDETNVTVTGIEAQTHIVMMDVGIWASSKSGGSTSRMRAYQELCNCFQGSVAYNKALNDHDFEIRRFEGGVFVKEDIGDIPVFRVTSIELSVRVHSRVLDEARTFVEQVNQDQQLETVDEETIVG